jgi:pyridinium-3,5-biscarboxylic acid mononucleotide sulfurtransferase
MSESNFDYEMNRLSGWFKDFESCIVAFSAGVDSSLLAFAAKKALGKYAYAATSLSPAFAESEQLEAKKVANEIGIELIELVQNDLQDPGYVRNEVTRCYFCRSNLAMAIEPVRQTLKIDVCVDGTHLDDLEKPRPGVKALRENGFRAPYVELGLGKELIRKLARHVGLSNWNRPSEACLSSRVAYGQPITLDVLGRIDKAEKIVKELTGADIVRVRTIGRSAVVEVDKPNVTVAFQKKQELESELALLGYESIRIDPEGYVSGKMLELFVTSTER